MTASEVRPGLSVLDVGCGTGNVLVEVLAREATAEVTGVDLSTAMLRRAEAKPVLAKSPSSRFWKIGLPVAT